MKGYWGHFHDPSANKFVMLRDQIYYKTDDQVYQENGVYYFAGRSGNMIKMRGYRIYPQEVENTIRQIETVGACYVFMDERGTIWSPLLRWISRILRLRRPCWKSKSLFQPSFLLI